MAYIDMTSYDGIILDIMLPGKDGYEILRELRQREDDTPVLLLTAKDSIEDRVKGLDLGADDYLIKPFAFEELLARIRVMMRRKPQFTSNQLKIADLILDRDTRKVTRAGNEIPTLSTKRRTRTKIVPRTTAMIPVYHSVIFFLIVICFIRFPSLHIRHREQCG